MCCYQTRFWIRFRRVQGECGMGARAEERDVSGVGRGQARPRRQVRCTPKVACPGLDVYRGHKSRAVGSFEEEYEASVTTVPWIRGIFQAIAGVSNVEYVTVYTFTPATSTIGVSPMALFLPTAIVVREPIVPFRLCPTSTKWLSALRCGALGGKRQRVFDCKNGGICLAARLRYPCYPSCEIRNAKHPSYILTEGSTGIYTGISRLEMVGLLRMHHTPPYPAAHPLSPGHFTHVLLNRRHFSKHVRSDLTLVKTASFRMEIPPAHDRIST